MLYCSLKCRQSRESKTPKFSKASKGKVMILLKCALCEKKMFKKQDFSGLLSNLGLKTSLSKISVLGDISCNNIK